MAKGGKPRCPVCHSRRWHRDALSGSVVCEDGHLLQGYVQETTETQEASQYATQTRRLRKNKERKVRPPTNDHFHGDRAVFLLHQALQLILRCQLKALIDNMGFPPELENVCRDLWAMLVASQKPPATPCDFERGEEAPDSYSGPRVDARYYRKGRKRRKFDGKADEEDQGEEKDGYETASEAGGPSSANTSDADVESSDDEDADVPSAPPPPTLPTANPAPGAKEDGDDDPYSFQPRTTASRILPPRQKDPRERPRAEFTLAILYLGCMTLRLPVLLKDILDLAETFRIPYLSGTNVLPVDMVSHLNLANRQLLNPPSVPRAGDPDAHSGLQAWLAKLVRMYQDDWGVYFPEANLPLLTWRLMRSLALPPTFYLATTNLLAMVPSFSFELPAFRTGMRQPGALYNTNKAARRLPEAVIVAAALTLIKLAWGKANSQDDDDEPELLPPIKVYLHALASLETLATNDPEDPRRLWQKDVASLADDEIDAYLSFFEENVVPKHSVPKHMADIDLHFPEPLPPPLPPQSASSSAKVDDILSRLYATNNDPMDVITPSEVSSALSVVLDRASSLIGFKPEEISEIVEYWWAILAKENGEREKESRDDALEKRSKTEGKERWDREMERRKDLQERWDGFVTVPKPHKPRSGRPRKGAKKVEEQDVDSSAGSEAMEQD